MNIVEFILLQYDNLQLSHVTSHGAFEALTIDMEQLHLLKFIKD